MRIAVATTPRASRTPARFAGMTSARGRSQREVVAASHRERGKDSRATHHHPQCHLSMAQSEMEWRVQSVSSPFAMTEYRIDDLARAAGTTTRNVRGYQDRGLLPRPLKRGAHRDLHRPAPGSVDPHQQPAQARVHRRHIADFIRGMQRGDDLAKVLGVDEILAEPWSTAKSERVTADALRDIVRLRRRDGPGRTRTHQPGPTRRRRPPPSHPRPRHRARHRTSRRPRVVAAVDHRGVRQAGGPGRGAAGTLISAAREEFVSRRGEGWVPEGEEESEWAAVLMSEMRETATKAAHNALNRALDRALRLELKDYFTPGADDAAS